MDGTLLNKKYRLEERVTALEEGGGGGGLPDYSTDEQDTGQKWIDGSKIYRKVFSNLSASLVSGQAVDTTVDISDVAKILYGFARADDEISYIPTAIYKINNTLQLLGYQTGNVIKTVILYYTKDGATRKKSTRKKTEE